MNKLKSKIKKNIETYKEAIIMYLITPLTVFIVGLIYGMYDYKGMTSFLNKYGYFFAFATIIIYATYLIKKYKIKTKKFDTNSYPYLLLSISTAVFLNNIIFLFHKNNTTSNHIIIIVIGSVVIGPIIEEIVYRYILFGKLAKKYKKITSAIITTVIFAISHDNIINIIYACFLGTIFIATYLKNKNIRESIMAHMLANLVVIFIVKFNLIVFLISFIIIIISIIIITKQKKDKKP